MSKNTRNRNNRRQNAGIHFGGGSKGATRTVAPHIAETGLTGYEYTVAEAKELLGMERVLECEDFANSNGLTVTYPQVENYTTGHKKPSIKYEPKR